MLASRWLTAIRPAARGRPQVSALQTSVELPFMD